MGVEIERKFLVSKDDLNKLKETMRDSLLAEVQIICQGYLLSAKKATVRVRWSYSSRDGKRGFLTVKGSGTISRPEFEMPIDEDIAVTLLQSCTQVIKKRRYRVNTYWEVDEFINVLDPETGMPLVVAEIELSHEDQPFHKPLWLGKEVTEDSRYANVNLASLIRETTLSANEIVNPEQG